MLSLPFCPMRLRLVACVAGHEPFRTCAFWHLASLCHQSGALGREGTAMGQGRLLVVVTRHLPPVVETRLKELFDVELRDPVLGLNAPPASVRHPKQPCSPYRRW